MSQATHHDAELILKLYDMRREPVMREARNFFATFNPATPEDMLAMFFAFEKKENAYLRQVLSFWEMAAALVNHGTINAALAHDTLGEMTFVYAKVQPYVKAVREKLDSPEFMQQVEKLVEGSAEGRERLARTQKRMAEFAKMMQARAAKQG
jgi:hypothetical protein